MHFCEIVHTVQLRFVDTHAGNLEPHITITHHTSQSHRIDVEPIHVRHHTQKYITIAPSEPVAGPGFYPGGCANSQNCYYFSNFC